MRCLFALVLIAVAACSSRTDGSSICVGLCGDAGSATDSGTSTDAGSVASRVAYARCQGGDTCGGGTTCVSATFTSTGGTDSLCSVTCAGSTCPLSTSPSALAPVCVINTTGVGLCYLSCTGDGDCGAGTVCRAIPGAGAQVCLPIGATVTPTAPPAFTGCTPPGATCANGTTCLPASFMRPGAAQGNTCTIPCTSGNAAMCPGYAQDPTRIECVAPNGNVAAAQCMRLCNPSAGDADCAPYLTRCVAIPMAAGTLTACVP